jgi:protein gp37
VTKIEWVKGDDGSKGLSWNSFRAVVTKTGRSANHCETVNEACRFCYAAQMNRRHGGFPFKPGHRKDYTFVIDEKKLLAPLRRKKPTRIFVESMSDAFGAWWPTSFLDQLYAAMLLSPWHTYINLSKRPDRRREYLNATQGGLPGVDVCTRVAYAAAELGHDITPVEVHKRWPLANVIEGTSVSCQEEADEFVPIVLSTNAAWRAVSAEPLLGPIDFAGRQWLPPDLRGLAGRREPPYLDWIIAGGESGRRARPMHPQWVRDIRDQCEASGAEFFFKQWGEFASVSEVEGEGPHFRFPDGATVRRLGKEAAGRLLDGREWNGFPDMTKKAA